MMHRKAKTVSLKSLKTTVSKWATDECASSTLWERRYFTPFGSSGMWCLRMWGLNIITD